MAALLGGGDVVDVPLRKVGVDHVRVSRLRLRKIRWKLEEGGGSKKGRNNAQVGLLLWNAALGFTTKNDESTGTVIVANRSILEGRGRGTLCKAGEIDPLKGGYLGVR
jgi:hypothetical protein